MSIFWIGMFSGGYIGFFVGIGLYALILYIVSKE